MISKKLQKEIQLFDIVRMLSQNSNFSYDGSFFQCYICLLNVKKPRMCPSCSKLACETCLRKWIEDSKSECPHCRKVLPLSGFADCERLVNDIKHLMKSLDSTEKHKEKCHQHSLEMQYFCKECKQPICSDCGMFGVKHKGHEITHLSKVYQEKKNKILNELARFDQKIQVYRKNGFLVKLQMQKLMIEIGQKKSFIEEYFLSLIERLQEQFKQKKIKLETQYQQNTHEVQLLEAFRDQVCHQLQGNSEKEIINNSEQLVQEIKKHCDREKDRQFEEEEYTFETIQQIVPKYETFSYKMEKYLLNHEGITYSDPYIVNGIQWRLKIYPRGNGVAKDTYISVFLQMSKAYSNQNKYEYKIELVNNYNPKDTIIRQYSSKFDIGECWGYNQFVPLNELQNGFLDIDGSLKFNISVRNPTYRSLVRDQENYIKFLQNKLKSNEQGPNSKSKQLIAKLSRNSETQIKELKKALLGQENSLSAHDEYFGEVKSKSNSNQIADNMARLEADSVQAQQQFRMDHPQNSSRLSSP